MVLKNVYDKNFHNALEKIFTILWGIWSHGNEAVLKKYKSNPVSVLGKAHYMVYYTSLYNKKAVIDPMSCCTSDKPCKPRVKFLKTS